MDARRAVETKELNELQELRGIKSITKALQAPWSIAELFKICIYITKCITVNINYFLAFPSSSGNPFLIYDFNILLVSISILNSIPFAYGKSTHIHLLFIEKSHKLNNDQDMIISQNIKLRTETMKKNNCPDILMYMHWLQPIRKDLFRDPHHKRNIIKINMTCNYIVKQQTYSTFLPKRSSRSAKKNENGVYKLYKY